MTSSGDASNVRDINPNCTITYQKRKNAIRLNTDSHSIEPAVAAPRPDGVSGQVLILSSLAMRVPQAGSGMANGTEAMPLRQQFIYLAVVRQQASVLYQ